MCGAVRFDFNSLLLVNFSLRKCIVLYGDNKFNQMNRRSESETRLRQVYTPRIKDGRNSNDFASHKKINMTDQKNAGIFNPESPQKVSKIEIAKHIPNYREDDKMIKWDNVQTEAGSPVKFISNFVPPRTTKARDKQHKFSCVGRKLEYPQDNYRNIRYMPQQKGERDQKYQQGPPSKQRIQRVQSATLTREKNYSKKSQQIKEKNANEKQKIKVVMNYLLQNNEQYLAERSRLCQQKARPKSQIFKIQLANALTEYKQKYPPKQAQFEFEIQPQNQKTTFSLPPRKVCGNSTSNQFHNGQQSEKRANAAFPEGFKLQGPIYSVSTYMNHYLHNGDFEKMVPVATWNEHPMGLHFSPETTHRKHYKGEPYPKADLATWNNMHPYGNDFNQNKPTTYRSAHNIKQKQPIQTWPNYGPRLIISKGKFTTQYQSQMKNHHKHQIHQGNICKCGSCGRKGRKTLK